MVLKSLSVLVVCFIYLHLVYMEGLYAYGDLFSFEQTMVGPSDSYLPGHFGLHFVAVSLLVYGLMALVTCLGVYVPARRISTISPVEALKDE